MKSEPNNTHIVPYHSRLKEEATLNMIFSFTNSDCLAQLTVNLGILSPTLNINPTLFVVPCKFFGGL